MRLEEVTKREKRADGKEELKGRQEIKGSDGKHVCAGNSKRTCTEFRVRWCGGFRTCVDRQVYIFFKKSKK